MAYVPPALRKKQQASGGGGAEQDASANMPPSGPKTRRFSRDNLPRVEDIYEHFWPVDAVVQNPGITGSVNTTLHASAARPDRLEYVLLFHGANPRWPKDKIIFVKSNIRLLPGAPKYRKDSAVVDDEQHQGEGETSVPAVEEKPPPTKDRRYSGQDTAPQIRPSSIAAMESPATPEVGAIAVFQQAGKGGGMHFIGYHKISHVQFLAPRSADLIRMLEQKWTHENKDGHIEQIRRDSGQWQRSLAKQWAVLKLEDDKEANTQLAPPDITMDKAPKKSVNELLREMRLGNNEARA